MAWRTDTKVAAQAPDGMDRGILRGALRHFALAPASRELDRPPVVAAALRWLEKASLPVSEVGKPQHARAVLDAISVTQDGRAASTTTIARKRSVFANVIRYAVELEELAVESARPAELEAAEGLRSRGPARRDQPAPSPRAAHRRDLRG